MVGIPPKRFNWHALRHFAASCWIDAGPKRKTIQTFAGHSTLAVTMDIYGHLFKSDDHKAAMDEIDGEFAGDTSERPQNPRKHGQLGEEFIP